MFSSIAITVFLGALCALTGFLLTPFPYENLILLHLDKGTAFSMEEISRLTEDSVISLVYPYAREKTVMESTGSQNINCVLYREAPWFFQDFPAPMIDGRVLWPEDAGRRFALISDHAAVRLFGRGDAAGETVTINKEPFQIIGVYGNNREFLTKMAYYGEEIVYVMQNPAAPLEATHMAAALKYPRDASIGLRWLEQFKAVKDNLISVHNLAQSWSGLRLIAKACLCAYSLLFLLAATRKTVPVCAAQRDLIRVNWKEQYFLSMLRLSWKPLFLIAGIVTLLSLWGIGLAVFFLGGVSIPAAYIPSKLLWEPVKNAFLLYLTDINARETMRHPLVTHAHWWRVLLLTIGTIGGGTALSLRKKWMCCRCGG